MSQATVQINLKSLTPSDDIIAQSIIEANACSSKLNYIYTSKRSHITVIYNDATFSWSKPRHFEDWQGILALGEGINQWLDDDGTPHDFTHQQVVEISGLIRDRKQALFTAKKLDEIDIANGIYTLTNISSL